MEINYSFFADAVSLDSNQKVNALGIFDNINSYQFPVVHPRMFFVIKIKAHRSEVGVHKIKLNFVDQDGKIVVRPLESELTITDGINNSTIIIELNNTTFERPGAYAVDVTVDGHHIGSTSLAVFAVQKVE